MSNGSPDPPPPRRTSWPSEASLIEDIAKIDLKGLGLVSRGKLPVIEYLQPGEAERWSTPARYSSFDEVICLDQADDGYPPVLLIDYDGTTNGRIVDHQFRVMEGMTRPGTKIQRRVGITNSKIRMTREYGTPYLVLPVLSQQQLSFLTDEPLVARFAVIRGLLQAIDMGLIPDVQVAGLLPGLPSTRSLRSALIPHHRSWERASGLMENFGREIREAPSSMIGFHTRLDDPPPWLESDSEPTVSPNLRVELLELPSSEGHPNWTEDFMHLPTGTVRTLARQVESRRNLPDSQLHQETGYTRSGWPVLVLDAEVLGSPIHAEFLLDGFDTNFGCDEELMMEPYLGVVGSALIEAGFFGDLLEPDDPPAWKQDRLSLHTDSEED